MRRLRCREAPGDPGGRRVARFGLSSLPGALLVMLAACATTAPPAPSDIERWWTDLEEYEAQVQTFEAESSRLQDEFRTLRSDPHLAGVLRQIVAVATQAAMSTLPTRRSESRAEASGVISITTPSR